MTGLNDTDIRLTDAWELTRAADGDAPLCSGLDCLYQNIILEALTQPGDLFYDAAFGWGLYDFIQSEDGDLVRLQYQIGRVYDVVYLCRRWDDNSDASLDIVKIDRKSTV